MKTLQSLLKKEKIAIISCYDASFASMLSRTHVDALLVGDSLGTRIKGEKNILNVTMDEVIYHIRAVKNGAKELPIIADMPANSYNNKSTALANAKKIIEAGADMIKLEGGKEIEEIIKHLSKENIFICGHIGFTPQTKKIEEFKLKSKDLLNDARLLQDAGISMIVLSMMDSEIDFEITRELKIPTISYQSSDKCTGSVEILYDLLGLEVLKNNQTNRKIDTNFHRLNFQSIQDFIKKTHQSK